MNRLKIFIIFSFTICGFAAPELSAEWVTGPALNQRLAEPVDLVWSENPLRDALANFSRVQEVAVLLDRRIDPSRKMSLSLNHSPLGESLAAIAMTGELGVTLAGPVVYFGPADSTPKLRTLIFLREEEARKMQLAAAKVFFQEKLLAWNDFSQPRAILERLGKENRLTISGIDRIPYDLWAAADLPPMTLVERLSLIAFQFDLTFKISTGSKRLELVPIPPDIRLTRSYPAGKEPEKTAKRFSETVPQAEINIAGDKIIVKGMLDDHERLESPTTPGGGTSTKNATPELKNKRFTLTVTEKPIGLLLKQLAKQVGLQLQMDEPALAKAGVSLDQLVSFKVEDATIDELLQAAIKETPLKFRRRGNVLIVEALKK